MCCNDERSWFSKRKELVKPKVENASEGVQLTHTMLEGLSVGIR